MSNLHDELVNITGTYFPPESQEAWVSALYCSYLFGRVEPDKVRLFCNLMLTVLDRYDAGDFERLVCSGHLDSGDSSHDRNYRSAYVVVNFLSTWHPDRVQWLHYSVEKQRDILKKIELSPYYHHIGLKDFYTSQENALPPLRDRVTWSTVICFIVTGILMLLLYAGFCWVGIPPLWSIVLANIVGVTGLTLFRK